MINAKDRVPTKPNRKKITFEDDNSVRYATVEYADLPTEQGTPINKALFNIIAADSNGSYIGTGVYGASNPNTLTFDFEPKFAIVYGYNTEAPEKQQGTCCVYSFAIFIRNSPHTRVLWNYGWEGGWYNSNLAAAGIPLCVSWGNNSLSWYYDSEVELSVGSNHGKLPNYVDTQLNKAGVEYYYMVLG